MSSTNLLSIMANSIFRDEVMYWLSPLDALSLRLTCREMIPTGELGRYTNVFKYIIPDRSWLRNRMKEGYNFTVLSSKLKATVKKENILPITRQSALQGPTPIVYAVLVVTKDEQFVPCDREFMPTHLFAISTSDSVGDKDSVLYTNTVRDYYRDISVDREGFRLELTCLMSEHSTNMAILTSTGPGRHDDRLAKDFDHDRMRHWTEYAHMSANKSEIVGPVFDEHYRRNKDTTRKMFSITTRFNGCFGFHKDTFRIDKADFMCEK